MLRFGFFLMGWKGAAGHRVCGNASWLRLHPKRTIYGTLHNGPVQDRCNSPKKRELRAGGRVRRERPSVGSPWRERVLGRRDNVRWHLLVRPDPDRKRPQL